MKTNIKILERVFLGRDAEVLFIQHEAGFEVSVCIQTLQKPYYCNQLFKHFIDEKEAKAFFDEIKVMKEQKEVEEGEF
ncbi:hypothetical protein GVK96_01000 [Enterococcus hirae]|uniref:hypothetical protein n=1 Tax=Enterococcus hirae TaxID=1354 RepID=UPI00137706B1|nr:hypothetical protein [Enterococcus hirae]NBA38097.1 hypothetical protein [Enterococcus hirae]